MKVVWTEEAKYSLLNIYNYILKQSVQNAEMVVNTLIDLGESLSNEKLEYSKDLILDDEKFRSISKWSYKLVYERTKKEVIILDVFSNHQNPEKLFDLKK